MLCRFNLREWKRSSLCYANCFLELTYAFLNKTFHEIKLFICHCSFIILGQKTTVRLQIVRCLDVFVNVLSIELLFIFLFITCHSRIFAACTIQEFLQLCCVQCAVCCSFSITWALNTAEYRLNEVYCVCLQLFVYGFIFSLKSELI